MMSKTPICDFVKKYADSCITRLHMPGHKGSGFLGVEKYDITEIDGADVLYKSAGIIRESENVASELFGTERTVYSCEGSSLSIRAMLYLALLHGKSLGKKPVILAARNAHKVFMTASALLDFETVWMFPEKNESIVSCVISPSQLDKKLTEMTEKPVAVYVTSPDYLGNMSDIGGLSAVCKKNGVLLLVDNAHGAYLAFTDKKMHPIALGADMCCDSSHKTLPVLTGGGYLHISKDAPELFSQQAENAMSIFASTSPSYLIMQSIDMANKYIYDGYCEKLACFIETLNKLKSELEAHGFILCGNEPLKLTISAKLYGYTGFQIAEILENNSIVCEFSDPDYVTMMFTPEIGEDAVIKLENVLKQIPKKEQISEKAPDIGIPEVVLSPREAMFAVTERIPAKDSAGRILAQTNVSCPPAIPIVVCGEKITEEAVKLFEYYGIEYCDVIK